MKFGGIGKEFGQMGDENTRKKAAAGGGGGGGASGTPIGLLLVLTYP